MKIFSARHITLLAVAAISACGSDASKSLDPTATYDVYGVRFEPGVAVPAPAVFAEPEMYVGRKVIIEGMASGDCADPACLAILTSGGGGQISVLLSSEEGAAADVPAHVGGRRMVVSGTLEGDAASSQTTPEKSQAPNTSDHRLPATSNTLQAEADSTFRLYATGFMIEKVRR